jgi:putative transposase
MSVQVVEQHGIKESDPRFAPIDQAAFAAKNLFNKANYLLRQSFIHQGQYISYPDLDKQLQGSDEDRALPAKVSQQVLRSLDPAWQSFFAAMQEWREHPDRVLGRAGLPGSKDKQKGRYLLLYTQQAISRKALKQGLIQFSKLPVTVQTKQHDVEQGRIVPRKGFYCVQVVYSVEPQPRPDLDPNLVAGVDVGVNVLAAVPSNKPGFEPVLVNGRPLKSINQFYNKEKAQAQQQLPKGQSVSRRIQGMSRKRNRRVKHYLHVASRRVIDLLVSEGIGTLIVGKNPTWKQGPPLGKRNNQQFVSIPHTQFIQMLTYKAQWVGIQVVLIEESYTSKTSFLDLEPVERQREYAGRRLSRGLFRAGDGRRIQADVNASFNIIRKAIPNAFADGIHVVSASGGGRCSASIGLPAHEWLVSCLSMPLVTIALLVNAWQKRSGSGG